MGTDIPDELMQAFLELVNDESGQDDGEEGPDETEAS